MPAAAVIPAPKAYIKVVAVKKLVVGYLRWWSGPWLTPWSRVLAVSSLPGCSLALSCWTVEGYHLL